MNEKIEADIPVMLIEYMNDTIESAAHLVEQLDPNDRFTPEIVAATIRLLKRGSA